MPMNQGDPSGTNRIKVDGITPKQLIGEREDTGVRKDESFPFGIELQ